MLLSSLMMGVMESLIIKPAIRRANFPNYMAACSILRALSLSNSSRAVRDSEITRSSTAFAICLSMNVSFPWPLSRARMKMSLKGFTLSFRTQVLIISPGATISDTLGLMEREVFKDLIFFKIKYNIEYIKKINVAYTKVKGY